MKQVLCIITLLQIGFLYSEFTLQTIENRSDLQFKSAYHKPSGKETKLSALTDVLQKSNSKQHVVIDRKVGSGGLALAMIDDQGHYATIFMHDQAGYSIEYKRNKTKQIAKFPDIASTGTGPYTAQVMMQDAVDGKMVAEPKSYSHQEQTAFNLNISGNRGKYQISLHPTA